MSTRFPAQGELGALVSVHEVHPLKGMGAQLTPGVIGVVFFILPALALLPQAGSPLKGAAIGGSLVAGVALCLLSRFLVRRKLASMPTVAVYQRGVAIQTAAKLHWLPVGSFHVLQRDLIMLGRSVNSIRITGAELQVELPTLHYIDMETLARHLRAMLVPGG